MSSHRYPTIQCLYVEGLEIHNAHKTLNRTKVLERVAEARTAITSSGGGPLFLAIPAHPELLAKYYDLRALMKKVDLMMLQTHALGAMKKMTYHPSRLSGLWDMMNTVIGLGVPASKIVISLPATAQQFTLQNETLSTPGSPTLEDEPKEIGQDELCRQLQRGRWTLERDQDLSAPYAFKDKTWISFEDASSVDVKGKYARVRGLAGLALHRATRDVDNPYLWKTRFYLPLDTPVLWTLCRFLPTESRRLWTPMDTRTEFSCSRQGYFVHPRSCARFYRCVKFDQLSPEYTVFEFDCPAGLAFDSRYEVCVWPGSLPDSQACPGSSEIAPVPRTRFICPEHEGYYADPENCRWFFACLDHGKAPLTAYEFRCPFGLGFDAEKLKCDWPWLVPTCGNIARYEAEVHGYSAATLTGAAGFQGQTADSVNVAAHQSLVSGASLNNLVGIQGGYLTHGDALDSNFIASQELQNGADQYQITHAGSHSLGLSGGLSQGSNGLAYQSGEASNLGLVQATNYNDGEKYTSGSIILDDYRLPTKKTSGHGRVAGNAQIIGASQGGSASGNSGYSSSYSTANLGQKAGYNGYSTASLSGNAGQTAYQSRHYDADQSGAYVHDPTGDTAEPYKHVDSPVEPYIHQSLGYKDHSQSLGYKDNSQSLGYKDSSKYYDYGRYKGSSEGQYEGKYSGDNSGQYNHDNLGAYLESSSGYNTGSSDNSGGYVESSGGYNAGTYKADYSGSNAYKADNSGTYNADYSGSNTYKTDYSDSDNSGAYNAGYSGSNAYSADNSGAYNAGSSLYKTENSGVYNADYSGSYTHDNSGQYEAGVYRTDGHIGVGGAQSTSSVNVQSYSQANAGNYISDSKAYTGSSHTLTAGAVNVGLVGKTTLVDADYNNQNNYQGQTAYTQSIAHQTLHPGQVSFVSQPAVSITHVGTDENNLDGYGYVTTPTSSGIPTTATPFAVTTALPAVTYKTTFLPEEPKSSIKQIFGYSQPAVTVVQPKIVAVKQQYVTPQVQAADYNQGLSYQYESKDYDALKANSQSASSYNSQSGTNYNSESSGAAKTESGYVYSKPSIKFEDGLSYSTPAPAVSVSSYKPQGFGHSQQTLHKIESVGFQYSNPTSVTEQPFQKLVAYTTTGPAVTTFAQPTVSSYPQSYSHQTLHKVEASNVQVPSVEFGSTGYTSGVTYEQPQTVVQYKTAQPAISVQPTISTYQPQVFSQQTLHQVDSGRVKIHSQDSTGYKYEKPAVQFEDQKTIFKFSTPAPTVVQYSTPAPAVVSTYRPQVYSQQTFHKIESRPLVTVSSTPAPIVHYEAQRRPVSIYQNPILQYTQPKVTPVTYVQPTYQPQAYSHQTIHKSESSIHTPSVQTGGYQYTKSTAFEQPKNVFQYTTAAPAIAVQPVVSTYQPAISTYQPAVSTYQPAVSTYQPQVYRHQTSQKVDTSQFKTYSDDESRYQYSQPSVKFEDTPQTVLTYSTTPRPAVVSTYKPQSFSHQTIHKAERQNFGPVSSTALPQVDISYQTAVAPVSTYQNPILKFTQKVTPVTYVKPTAAVFTQTYQPIVQKQQISNIQAGQEASQQSYDQNVQLNQGYSYSQPEIQSNTARKAYSDASVVSHQSFHLSSAQYDSESQHDTGKDVVFVSTTPSTLAYEEHYSDYEAPKKIETYQAPEYIPPKAEYQQSYSVASSAAPVVQESFVQTQEQYVRPVEYSQTYETVQKNVPGAVSFSTSHVSEPKRIESYHISTFPGTKATINYKQTYENPEIQVQYKAEDYLPPVVSTEAPVVTPTYRPRTYSTTPREYLPPTYSTASTTREYLPPSTTREYLPPSSTREYLPPTTTTREYLPPAEPKYKEREYLPPVENTYFLPSTTAKTLYKIKSTTPAYQYTEATTEYKASEYLPPVEQASNVVNFESFGFNKLEATAAPKIRYNPYQEIRVTEEVTSRPLQRKPNIVVETAKSNLLGFGTVGPDAGLVSPVTYTTAAPIVVSSTSRPIVRSRTQTPYKYVEYTTAYKAPEYLPPSVEELNIQSFGSKSADQSLRGRYSYQENAEVVSTFAPIQRKQNIVVQTAKANLKYSSIGSDAGLVSPVSYTTSTPVVVSSSEAYTVAPKRVTTTYAPEEQGLFEVTPQAPRRRTKPKVAVVTKINDFNPLLVRKLGAVCSCQSPVLVLKGTRPNTPVPKDFDDYSNDYEESGRGDIGDNEWAQKSARVGRPTVTTSPIVTSTFNPIIVPDDSYYQDYQEPSNFDFAVTPKNAEVIVSSTPTVTSTQRVVRIRPRVKAVTLAPTYRTVLQNQEVSSTIAPSETLNSEIESQSFDRYGPGGWRSRDETLQGSVDCKRAGLFRHPKQCNKFYACRWDCTKQRFTLHVFNCPVQLSFDPNLGACNWPSQGPACQGDTLLTNTL
ncbi:Chitinase-3-like protein 3 [Operophtera brumata]|uniref:Chitinase-3-like protein 3 n=1 Tax=Operophtera brumata TaxID=104452 RepID=A0A0L7LGF7_OPEBR|nr:Chitinase-3-like protein 3 [Operophtera brumata]